MREFARSFQIFIRQDLPAFLLMTGLYENVSELQNVDNLTFLYRAPKIELSSPNIGAVAANYQRTFKLDRTDALEMDELTKGYSSAFQALGYLTWEADGDYHSVRAEYRQYLEEYVCEKIWSELSAKDREVAQAIAASPDGGILGIRNSLDMSSNQFDPYRRRLMLKGIVNGDVRGHVSFTLPLFDELVSERRGSISAERRCATRPDLFANPPLAGRVACGRVRALPVTLGHAPILSLHRRLVP